MIKDDFYIKKPKFNKYPPKGITLELMIRALVAEYGWTELGRKIYIRCFVDNPTLKSSLNFLNKHEWAKFEVEDLYYWRFGGKPDDFQEKRDKAIALAKDPTHDYSRNF